MRYALEGSAQKSGTRVRVDAQLIDAGTGAHLWADQFDADQADILAMQDEIVTRLARALQIELTTEEASRVARAHPENPDAEELALQCEADYLRIGLARTEMLPAYRLCEQALAIDSRNVRALVILALRHLVLARNLQSDDPQTDRLKAGELISRALAVDFEQLPGSLRQSVFPGGAAPGGGDRRGRAGSRSQSELHSSIHPALDRQLDRGTV